MKDDGPEEVRLDLAAVAGGDASPVVMTFRRIPAGEFLMGSRPTDWRQNRDEQPRHAVSISRPFYLGIYPVKQAEFACFRPDHRGYYAGDDHAVNNRTWHDAIAFCEWINRALGGLRMPRDDLLLEPAPELEALAPADRPAADWPDGFFACLPTEVQWEYACRAGTETDYYTGDGEAALRRAGWYQGNSSEIMPVGRRNENARGLHDLHGNVWEWCRDVYRSTAYQERADGCIDPEEAADTDGEPRVLRGGAWYNPPDFCRSASRGADHPGGADRVRGFRVGLFPGPSCASEAARSDADG